jgi:hypothetical protein
LLPLLALTFNELLLTDETDGAAVPVDVVDAPATKSLNDVAMIFLLMFYFNLSFV